MIAGRLDTESPEYAKQRDELLAAEVALRDQQERVAELRRALPLDTGLENECFEEMRDGQRAAVTLSELFEFRRDYKDWINLRHETAGYFEPEWNDFDRLTPATKMLHNTKRRTQPWKTGLPVDYMPAEKLRWLEKKLIPTPDAVSKAGPDSQLAHRARWYKKIKSRSLP